MVVHRPTGRSGREFGDSDRWARLLPVRWGPDVLELRAEFERQSTSIWLPAARMAWNRQRLFRASYSCGLGAISIGAWPKRRPRAARASTVGYRRCWRPALESASRRSGANCGQRGLRRGDRVRRRSVGAARGFGPVCRLFDEPQTGDRRCRRAPRCAVPGCRSSRRRAVPECRP